ncbi:MAG: Cell division septal protein FtsQ [Verrucomicrobia bacterium]|nr:MAG: Cell division septal protein FtsQ [Verrucomicrobiota bacterium]
MSLFSNSNSNRRIKRAGAKRQQSLLEVTARPDKEQRRQSRRKVGAAFKVVLLITLASAVVFGSKFALKRLVWENPTYALDDIRVTTDGLLTRAQILEIMEVQDGRNIFTVDLAKARKALDLLPQVERVDLRRVLPSRIDVRISERQPIAWVAPSADTELGLDGKAFLVDTRGYVMRTRKILPEHLALPILTGVVMEDVAPGQKLPTAEAFSAVELIKLSADDLRWQPRVVDVSKGYCLLVTDQRKAKVTFGFDNIEGQLSRLRQIIDYVEPTQREFQSVNLMLERSVPIVFAPAPVVPAPETKPVKGKGSGKTTVGAGVSGGVPLSPSGGSAASVFVPPKALAVADGAASAPPPQPSLEPTLAPASGLVSPPVGGGIAEKSPLKKSPPARPLPVADQPPVIPSLGVEPRAQPEPPSPFKLARFVTTSAPPPAQERQEPRAFEKSKVEKPKRRAVEKEEEDAPPVRSKKNAVQAPAASKAEKPVERERNEARVEKSKPLVAPAPKPKPRNLPESEPTSLPPNESLRKLFNPHG